MKTWGFTSRPEGGGDGPQGKPARYNIDGDAADSDTVGGDF